MQLRTMQFMCMKAQIFSVLSTGHGRLTTQWMISMLIIIRNRRCGILMGKGIPAAEAAEEVGMAVEGISTAQAAESLAKQYGIEMPITESICALIRGEMRPEEAASLLMGRKTKNEMHIF